LQRLSIYPEFGGRSFQKGEIFSRNRELVAFLEAIGVPECQRPTPYRDISLFQTSLRGSRVLPARCLMKATLIPMPNAAKFSTVITRANRYISHHQSDCGVHCQNANQPGESGLLDPNENRITNLDQAD
jgi:hypothetical protein